MQPRSGMSKPSEIGSSVEALPLPAPPRRSPDEGYRLRRFWLRLGGGGWSARLAYRLGLQRGVVTERYRVTVAEWEPGASPVRVVFASDFHAGPWTDPRLLREALDAIAAAEPDLLLLGGDFVSYTSAFAADLPAALGAITAPLGRFAVLGNHDWLSGPEELTGALERGGVTVLFNRSAEAGPPGRPLSVCGIDDDLEGHADIDAAFAGAGPVRILLTHSPAAVLQADGHRFRLALAGHVHGGQIALPGGVPLVVPEGRGVRRYARGRFELGPDCTLIVGRGIGCSGVPFRLFSRSEVTVVELCPRPRLAPATPMAGDAG